jgi:RNA polymerase sigma-70 factor (ECF subfamily)
VVARVFADAMAFHGDLGLTAGAWAERIAGIVKKCGRATSDPAAASFVERLHGRDLYLATSCAASYDSAWRRFEALYQKHIRELVRCLARNPLQADEVGESLLVDLFLPDRSGHSRIASYDGRSSLATWLHVIVTHRVANERARKWNSVERPGEMPDVPDSSLLGELEAGLRTQRYGSALDAAFREVCSRLSAHERQMLVWRYQRGLLLEQIAARLALHASTVCRQLERLHVRIRKDVVATLSNSHGLTADAITECLNDIIERRQIAVPLLGLIGEGLPAPDRDERVVRQRQIA